MKYNIKDEYKRFMEEPDLIEVRKHILSKPNGHVLFDQYVAARVQVRNDEDILNNMSPTSNSYQKVKELVEQRRKIFEQGDEDLKSSLKGLEKFISSAKIVTFDPVEKGIDVLRNFLTAPSADEDPQRLGRQAEKGSLHKLFGR